MHYGEIISVIALGFGAVLGLSALFSPNWASRIVRLVQDPDPARPGGYSEFRGTFGGMFLFSHLMTLTLVMKLSSSPLDYLTTFVTLPLAMGWMGAAFGRLLSWVLDVEQNRQSGMIPVWIAMEFVTGLAIAAPFLQFL